MTDEPKPDEQQPENPISPTLPQSRSARSFIYESAARALGISQVDRMDFGFFDELQWEYPRNAR